MPDDLSLGAGGARRLSDERRFQGSGSIRGSVFMSNQSALPQVWTLEARPSKMLMGAEFAELRQQEFLQGERDFSLTELPFGSYDIIARSEQTNPRSMQVVLDRSNPAPFLTIYMEAAGRLEGRLVDAEGLPAEGVEMTLLKLPELSRRSTRTDELGLYRFEEAVDSAYQLIVGEYENPILPRTGPLRLQAPGMTYPDIKLPPLATLDLHVINEREENLGGVIVRGAGDNGGNVDAKTDIFGLLRVKHLPAGRYRLRFQSDGYRVRRSPIDLKLGQDNAYAIELLFE